MKRVIEFLDLANDEEKQERERLVVIKEACGNASVAIGLAFVLLWLRPLGRALPFQLEPEHVAVLRLPCFAY
jgi:hypothetical protein